MSSHISKHSAWIDNVLENYLEHQEYYTEDKEPVPTFIAESIQALSYAQSLLSTLPKEDFESTYLSHLTQNSSLMSKQIIARFTGKEMMMNAQEVASLCAPVYSPYNWDDLVESFLADSVQHEIMNGLKRDLDASSYFRNPVTLGTPDNDDAGKPMAVIDGTHRFCCYLMNDYAQIPVQLMYCSMRRYEPLNSAMITNITYNSTEPVGEDVLEYLMSVRVNDDFWVSADVASECHPGESSGEFSYAEFIWDDFRIDEPSHELLNQEILRRLNAYRNLNWQVKTYVYDYE